MMDFMELLTNIPNEQEIRVVSDDESILYAGKCGEMPFAVVKEAEDMLVMSIMASGDKLCVLVGGLEDFDPFGFGDAEDEDNGFDIDQPFN